MLTYTKDGTVQVLDFDRYYICHEYDGGEDYVGFTIPLGHPQAMDLAPRLQLTETATGEKYRIHALDQGAQTINVKARLDTQELQSVLVTTTLSSVTPASAVNTIKPSGWTVVDRSGITSTRTVKLEKVTRLDGIRKICKAFPGLTFRISTKAKQITLRYPTNEDPTLAFFSDEVNMKKRPQRKATTKSYYTRLYAEGKDGLTFADINDGKSYVSCTDYSDEVICAFWKDERYTDKASLLEDARARVKAAAIPSESYELAVVDLARLKPTEFSYLAVDVLDKVKVTDRQAKRSTVHNVARYTYYPFYPSLNVITLSTTPGTISKQQAITTAELQSYTSDFNEAQRAVIQQISESMKATDVMDASVIFHTNSAGKIYEIIICDTDDLSTAQDVWLWNKAGLAHSSTGYNGTYTTAITADGKIVADFIQTGTLRAIDIQGVTIEGSTVQGSVLKFGGDGTYGSLQGKQITPVSGGATYNGVELSAGYLDVQSPGGFRIQCTSSDAIGRINALLLYLQGRQQLFLQATQSNGSVQIDAGSGTSKPMIQVLGSSNRINLTASGGVYVNGTKIG